ncbi:MAG: DUF2292 domain-containing protein [Candidatus Latescibacteria bacterium]|nr:DUF2292 domain-containing protein [bacterium]MBD3424683.1 DUF2292 domain-containing protein [Candidatus Latescibacterota bacterium]
MNSSGKMVRQEDILHSRIYSAIREIRHGQVTIHIQDGKAIQINSNKLAARQTGG